MKVFQEGKDVGYLDDQYWWANPSNPNAFRIASLDEDYPEEYFREDHVGEGVVKKLCNYVIEYFKNIVGREPYGVIEFGCGGGWFIEEFAKMDFLLDVAGIEGSDYGIAQCKRRGVEKYVDKRDLRVEFDFMQYDVAVCTEVGEHIEPPFASVLVKNIINHSKFVWWSSEEPNTNRPHLHHPNEQPYQYWINLFDFYGYGCYMLPDQVYNDCEGRGRMIFYNRETIKI